jgi:prepilin-type processing-associated H-X9-DG protein
MTPDVVETPVIVLNWNGWEDTFDCLRSLAASSDVTAVWLVDNGSTANRSDEALAILPGLRLISISQNSGFAGGMNRALRIAVAEGYSFAYLLNNDCKVARGFLRATLDATGDSKVAIVGSRIAHAGATNSLFFDGHYHRMGQKHIDDSSRIRGVSEVNGAGMLVRLTALEQDGYFDERFFCYHEEVELCERLISAGWACAIADASLVLHKRERSDVNGNALYYRTRNLFLLSRTVHGFARFQRILNACQTAAVAGRRALREDRADQLSASADALIDGLGGRFGQRPVSQRRTAGLLIIRMVVVLLPVLRGLEALFSLGNRVKQSSEIVAQK